MNILTITGFLGSDAEVKTTQAGKEFTRLSIGHTPRRKVNGEWVDGETLWLDVTVWEALPVLVYAKGAKVIVTGALESRTVEKDGNKRTYISLNADTIGLAHRTEKQTSASFNSAPTSKPSAVAILDDEMPF
jgi:single-strand DNA-binding protein